ncbi:hypothetical protein ACFLS9_06265 [Bacteroidota bacterium]
MSTFNQLLENKKLELFILITIILLSIAQRIIPLWDIVFPGDGIINLSDVDSYFYLRSAGYTAVNFPEILRYDLYSFYPAGSNPGSSGLFSLTIAFLALLANGFKFSENITEIVAAWLPVILNALTIILLYKFVKRLTNKSLAFISIIIYLLYPDQALSKTVLGCSDQHVAEIFLGLLWVYGLILSLDYKKPDNRIINRLWFIIYPMPLALLTFTWQGAYMHYGILGVIVFIYCNLTIFYNEENITSLSRNILLYGSGLFLWLLTVYLFYPALFPQLFGIEETWRFAIVIIVTLGSFFYLRISSVLIKKKISKALIISLGIGASAMLIYLFITLSERVARYFNILFSRRWDQVTEQFYITIEEFIKIFGIPGILSFLTLPLLFLLRKRLNNIKIIIIPILYSLILILMWLKTLDFDYMTPISVSILCSFSLYIIFHSGVVSSTVKEGKKNIKFKKRIKGKKSAQKFNLIAKQNFAGFVFIILLFLWPFVIGYIPLHDNKILNYEQTHTIAWFEAMSWMKDNTPEVSVGLNTSITKQEYLEDSTGTERRKGMYGVLSHWDFGNFIAVKGKRPAMYARYPVKNSTQWLLETDEKKSLKKLCLKCDSLDNVKYVVIDGKMIGGFFQGIIELSGYNAQNYLTKVERKTRDGNKFTLMTFGERYNNSIGVRLYKNHGQGLGNYRLVYESKHNTYLTYHMFNNKYGGSLQIENFPINSEPLEKEYQNYINYKVLQVPGGYYYDGIIEPSVKIFEVVKGAKIRGRVSSSRKVIAELKLHSENTGRYIEYYNETVSDEYGNFEIIIPYSTESRIPYSSVHPESNFSLYIEEAPRIKRTISDDLQISEEQVQNGAIINLNL